MENTEIKKLVDKLNRWREMYYNEGETEVSDEEFDFEERRLKEMDPNNEYFIQVGRKLKSNTRDIKIEHEVPMLSMQKVQVAEDAVKWLYDISKIPGLYFDDKLGLSVWVDPKLDGISGKIVFDRDGNFSYGSTRGDGKVGAIIKFAADIDGVPKHFVPNSELRGEFIINKKYSKLINGPLRNNCSGILKRLEYTDDVKYVSFVIYDFHAYNPKNNIEFRDRGDKIKKIADILESLDEKFHIVPVEKTNNIPEIYDRYVNKLRKEWEYETDGIILTIDGGEDNYDLIDSKYTITTCHKYNMALKPPAEFASSVVTGIDIAVNRQKLSFVAKVNPIFINGVNVSRATLDNYQNMRKMKIGVGSTVLMKRSNDVIPKIVESYNEEGKYIDFLKITKCPVCGAELIKYYQDLACPNEYGCVGIFKSKVEYTFGCLGVKNIGPAVISGLVDWMFANNIKLTYSSLFELLLSNRIDDFLNEFYGAGKRSEIFKNAIKWMFDNMYEIKLLGGFNIPSIGEGELIKHNIKSFKDLKAYIKKVQSMNYLESAFDNVIFNWSKDENHIKDLLNCEKLLGQYFKVEEGIPEGSITYCISGEVPGYKKSELVKYLKTINNSLVFVDSVTVNTNFLISYETGTTKVLKAKKYNIPVYTIDDVIDHYGK